MRVGVLIGLAGFTIFLLKNLVDGQYAADTRRPVLWAHVAVVALAALAALMFRSKRSWRLRELRALELALIAVTTLFFSLYQISEFRKAEWSSVAAQGHAAEVLSLTGDSTVLRWFGLLVLYGFFVPNTWGRCARVLGAVALCPLAVTASVGWWEGTLDQSKEVLLEMGIWVGLAWAMSVYGSHKIAQLRQEVFEARKRGQYYLKQRLGSGGMGEVYLAEHRLLKRPCAIKLIRHELVADPTILLRFEREVHSMALLAHTNTVRIYDYGVADDGTFYYAMEYLAGLTLQELVQRHGPLPPGRAVHLLRQACGALREAHAMGLIHRDIKPGNLMTSLLGGIPDVLKLLDFGLVRTTPRDPDQERLSLHGSIIGTPAYLSPEQVSGQRDLDARSDIYSLGAVGYYLLSGHSPFKGKTPHHVMVAHLEQPVPPLTVAGREIPPDLVAVIGQCMEKDRAQRFSDVMSLERALADCECAKEWTEELAARWWQDQPGELVARPEEWDKGDIPIAPR